MNTIQQRISEIFDILPRAEQNILLVLSVVYTPIGQASLLGLLKSTGFDLETQKTVNRDFKERFHKMGFIVATNEGWNCHRDICDGLMKTAITKPWFNKVAQQIIMEKGGFSFLSPKGMVMNQIKKLRLFLYQGNETGFEANIALLFNEYNAQFHLVMNELFFDHFDKEAFMTLPEKIRFSVLNYTLINDFFSFNTKTNSNKHHVYRLLEESFGETKSEVDNDKSLLPFIALAPVQLPDAIEPALIKSLAFDVVHAKDPNNPLL